MRLAVILALVAGCAAARPCPIEPLPQGPPFLWKVQRGDGPVVWLYGTVHNQGAGGVPAAVWTVLEKSPRFASELGDLEPDPDEFRARVKLPRGKGLDFLLPADDWWDLSELLRDRVKPADLARVRPWYAMSLLTSKLAPPAGESMDRALARRARARGLAVDHLETYADQLAVLGEVGVADLQQALHARSTMRCDLDRMRASYDAGDADRMTLHLNVAGSGILLTDRNARWMAALEGYLASDGAFVAVGLGHLLGDGGLPALLVARGYSVERATTALP